MNVIMQVDTKNLTLSAAHKKNVALFRISQPARILEAKGFSINFLFDAKCLMIAQQNSIVNRKRFSQQSSLIKALN